MILYHCTKNYDYMFGCRFMAWDKSASCFGPIFALLTPGGF